MGLIKIYHHRDHNNGGKFDGNCAIDTMRAFGTYFDLGVRCRFRIMEIGSGLGTIWGVGSPGSNNQYALKVIEDSGEYYLRVRYFDIDYNFSDFKIDGDDIYETLIQLYPSGASYTHIKLTIYDRYHNELYYEAKANTSGEYTLSTANPYIGGSNSGSGIIEAFQGYVFDWDVMYSGTSDFTRYVFYKNFNSVADNEVADFKENYDGDIIGSQPSDFWPVRTDISDRVREGTSAIIKCKQDKFRARIGSSLNISLFKYSDIKRNDTIEIQINDDVGNDNASAILNITEIKNKIYSVTKIVCEDLFKSLSYVLAGNFGQKHYTIWAAEPFWFSTYVSAGTSDYYYDPSVKRDRYITMNYILEFIKGLLQYDNLFTYNITFFLGLNSDYWQMQDDVAIKYKYFALHLGMLNEMGKSDSTEENTQKMYSIFRELLRSLRFTYFWDSGQLKFAKLANGNTAFSKYFDEDTEKIRNYKFYQVEANILEYLTSGYPDYDAYYSAFASGDIDELIANNINPGYKLTEKELIINIPLIKHFWINRKETYASTMRPLNFNGGITFIDQYADIMDIELRGLKEFEEIKVRLTEDNSANFYYKEDDLIKRISKIKQEIA